MPTLTSGEDYEYLQWVQNIRRDHLRLFEQQQVFSPGTIIDIPVNSTFDPTGLPRILRRRTKVACLDGVKDPLFSNA